MKARMDEKDEEMQVTIDLAKALLVFLPDDVGKAVSKKLDKAYKHRMKSNKRLLEAFETIDKFRGESDE